MQFNKFKFKNFIHYYFSQNISAPKLSRIK